MDRAIQPSGTEKPAAKKGKPATILIVEDSPVQSELLRRALADAGYVVLAARDGVAGLAMAKANHPAAVVSDINMPHMDGYSMCNAIRHDDALKYTPVILLTMLSDPLDVIKGLNAGADAYMTKPYNIPTLISRLEALLAYPPAPPPSRERRKVDIRLAGETHHVDAHGPRILNLLISTYENAVVQNRELIAIQQALENFNQHLEKKVLEKTTALRDSERRFRSLIENSSDMVAVLDASGTITYASTSSTRVSGYESEYLLGRKFLDFVHPDDLPAANAALTDVIGSAGAPQMSTLRMRHKDGRWVTIESLARNAIDDPLIKGIVINSRDVTERRRAEQELEFKNTILSTQQETSPDAILIVDEGARIISYNRGFIKLWNVPAQLIADGSDEPVMQFITRQSSYPKEFSDRVNHLYEHREEKSKEEIQLRDGRVIDRYSAPMIGADANYLGRVWFFRDITERKRSEQSLARVNRALRTLSACNAALVHATDEKELLHEMCRIIVEIGGYKYAWVGYAEHDENKTVRPVARSAKDDTFAERADVRWSDDARGRGPVGTAIRTARMCVVNNAITDPDYAPWREHAIHYGYGSVVGFPLNNAGTAFGGICIYSADTIGFEQEELALLAELAGDLAFGIATIRARATHELSAQQLRRSMEGTIQAMASTLEMRDAYTAGHQRHVAELAVAIARKLNWAEDDIHGLDLAAIVHDLGKIQIPAEILSKPTKLSKIEFLLIQAHPQSGFDILKPVDFPWPIAEIVYQHHERLDGSGYPRGLKAEEILPAAKILAVADTVEAMVSHRPYRAGLGIDKALEEINKGRGTLFDASVVDACVNLFREKQFTFSS